MNALTRHFEMNGYTAEQQAEAMFQLLDSSLISDNCITPEDVWQADAERAVNWLVNQ